MEVRFGRVGRLPGEVPVGTGVVGQEDADVHRGRGRVTGDRHLAAGHPAAEGGQAKLAENIRYLMANRKRAKSLGEAGIKRVSELFTEGRFYREFAEVARRVNVW